MTVNFINPQGRENKAELTSEQAEILSNLEGYKIVEFTDPFTSDAPAVSKKLTIHSASDIIGCAACQS